MKSFLNLQFSIFIIQYQQWVKWKKPNNIPLKEVNYRMETKALEFFIACVPAAGFESFGIVLLEGMAAGVPVVASDIPGFRTVLDDGVQGVLVAPRDPQALAKAIVDLLRDPQRRARLGAAGRAKAAAYDWSRVARQVLDFYTHVIAIRR